MGQHLHFKVVFKNKRNSVYKDSQKELTRTVGYDNLILKHIFFDVKAHLAYLVTLRFVQKIYAFESNKQTKAGDGLNGKG